MPDLTVRAQLAHGREQLANGDALGALAVGRRILESFPRCVAAYTLLGEALLQLGRPEQAHDVLLRAWGACPESVPLDALALARADGCREGAQGLDRAGLACLWLRQGLASRAVRELRALLEEQPARYDLQVALAEALWRAGAPEEAARLSEKILAKHSDCLKALLISGRYWLHSERDADARRWLAEAQALDPENALAQEMFGAQAPLPPRVARLPYREEELPPLDLPYDDQDEEGEEDAG